MKHRQILLKMREQRNKELDELSQFLNSSFSFSTEDQVKGMHVGKMLLPKEDEKVLISPVQNFGSLLKKRKTILTLELPFKTDTTSVNRALVDSFPKNTPTEYEDPNNWAAGYFRTKSLYDRMVQGDHIVNLLHNKVWPTIKEIQINDEGNRSESFVKARTQDFVFNEIKDQYFEGIKSLPIKKSSLKTYLCHARNMLAYCSHQEMRSHGLPSGLQAKTLAEYFEYLEYNCLKKRSIDTYKNLIGIRLLFYAPASFRQLQEITLKHIDKVHLVVNFDAMSFPVPSTFVELACALFAKNDSLLQKDTKQLNKFIEKTTKTIGLKWVSPTGIRRSLPFICHQEQFVSKRLPRR